MKHSSHTDTIENMQNGKELRSLSWELGDFYYLWGNEEAKEKLFKGQLELRRVEKKRHL